MLLPIRLPYARFFCLCVLVALGLGACASPDKPPQTSATIAPKVTLSLPRPGDLGARLELDQLVTAHYGDGQTVDFESRVQVLPHEFRLVALDPLGRKALTIVWTDDRIDFQPAPWLPKGLKPENMLADIVLIHWPRAAIQQALGNPDAVVVDDAKGRSILVQGREIIRIDHEAGEDAWSGHWHYRNLAWKYDLDIRSTTLRVGNGP